MGRFKNAILIALLVSLPTVVLAAGAGNPSFSNTSASVNSAGDLVVSFSLTVLGNATTVNLTANASATYGCVNGGGNQPNAANKHTSAGPVSGNTNVTPHNGHASGTITVPPPSADGFSCPGGQKLKLLSVTYTDVSLTAVPATANVSGTFTRTF